MRISDWIDVLKAVQDGKVNNSHHTFPDPVVFAMKITKDGVGLLVARQRYGEEMELDDLDIMIENGDLVDIVYDKARETHEAVFHYQNSPDPVITEPKLTKKNVKSLFKKKRRKK